VSELAGWVGLAGPYDFIPIINPQTRKTFHHPQVPPESQPISHVSAKAPRTFLGVAKEDKEVDPERNSARLAERLQAVGVPVEFKRYDHVGHISLVGSFAQPLRWLSPALKDVSAFVKGLPAVTGPLHVKTPGAAPPS
jgi:acetyl esterase/lipase